MHHPEQIPSEKTNSFNFSFQQANDAKKSVEKDFENVSERILKITESEKFFVNGFPLLKNLVALGPTKSELKKIAKACERLADLIEIQKKLSNRMIVAEVANTDSNWLTNAFGDFTKEIEEDLQKLFED